MVIRNFEEARMVLGAYVPAAGRSDHQIYNLDRMSKLMDFLGNPQNNLKIIHIAGTSGKTSTSYYVAALLAQTGKKIGLTVKPHITEVNERVQINLVPLDEKIFCEALGNFITIIGKSDIQPSYFELLVAFAYWEFDRQKVDYAVIEVGLGGLVDGTNVISRKDKVCIITDIGIDHVNVLGNTLAEIAAQKAGIITPKNTVITYRQTEEVAEVIEESAKKQQAKLIELDSSDSLPGLGFLPSFQRRNFTLASAAVDYTLERDHIPALKKTQILHAAYTHIPARMEVFHKYNKIFIIDGAHNVQKLQALVAAVKEQFPQQSVAALVSFASGGEYKLEEAIAEIATLTKNITITTFGGAQDTPKHSVDPEEIATICRGLDINPVIIERPEAALNELRKQPEPILLVTGSFYLLNHIRPHMVGS